MSGFILAWLIGEGIIIYRAVKMYEAPPLPADLLGASGLFVLLAFLAEWQPSLAKMLAWGFDLAAFMYVASNKDKPACGAGVGQVVSPGSTTSKESGQAVKQPGSANLSGSTSKFI